MGKNVKKKDAPDEIIVSRRDNSNVHVMAALAAGKLGVAGPFFIPQGVKLNGEKYKELLTQQYFPAMSAAAYKAGLKPGKFRFQQDNAPSHTARDVVSCLPKYCKPFFKWPACSCDLSPLDFYVFSEVKRGIEAMESPPKTEADVRTAVALACASLDQSKIDASIENFVKRCKLCLQVNGLRFEHMMK